MCFIFSVKEEISIREVLDYPLGTCLEPPSWTKDGGPANSYVAR